MVLGVSELEQSDDLNFDGDTEDLVAHVHNLATGETTNLEIAGTGSFADSRNRLVLRVYETGQGEDLNGDGDSEDTVYHIHNLVTGETTNLTLAGSGLRVFGDWLWIGVSERDQGVDLNGDGDFADSVVHMHTLATGESTNLRLAGSVRGVSGDWLMLRVSEREQSWEDLNGDGDTRDNVVRMHNLATGETTNLRLAATSHVVFGDRLVVFGDRLVLRVSEPQQGVDLNGDGDIEDSVYHVVDLSRLDELRTFVRGDTNADGDRNVTDAVFVLEHLFGGGTEPPCAKSADANDSGRVDITDAVHVLNFLFADGPPPPAPFPECGPDPTPDDLTCLSFEGCE